ncbi:MAG TPA: sigma-70 family RNA polymerase sigma factor [Polyangiaceae bacterium]|nr:sigma-70 family RNA polymerase sigma factor [Polyangiaceae bacterium]
MYSALQLGAPAVPGSSTDQRVRRLVHEHLDAVVRTLAKLGVSDGALDDAAQQVFLVATSKLDGIELARERQYLLGIAVRIASHARRTVQRRRETPMDDGLMLSEAGPLPDQLVDERRAYALLESIVAELPDGMREAFVLFDIEELTAGEVAELLEIPLGTVASRVRRAREQVRQSLLRARKP